MRNDLTCLLLMGPHCEQVWDKEEHQVTNQNVTLASTFGSFWLLWSSLQQMLAGIDTEPQLFIEERDEDSDGSAENSYLAGESDKS